jgi:Nickel responsive protein SCO4226-like
VVFVVERYLPGLDQERLVGMLGKLGRATDELCAEGTYVRYLGSMIVPGDEACFCRFDGASEAAVAEANERAGVPFDRIVVAVAVPVTHDGS